MMKREEKMGLLKQHAARQWEIFCRRCYPGSGRYWEKGAEIDLVAPQVQNSYLIAECKWTALKFQMEKKLLRELEEKFRRSSLAEKMTGKKIIFRVFSQKDLAFLASNR